MGAMSGDITKIVQLLVAGGSTPPIMYSVHPGVLKSMDCEHNRRQLAPIGVKLDP